MTTLVVGANGLLGSNVVSRIERRGIDGTGTYHSSEPGFEVPLYQFDLREPDRIATILDRVDPDLVVNCAAMTDVDGCENDPERARQINGEAPGTLARCCTEREIAFTHVSTDYVFDGEADVPYAVNASPNPVQVYGRTKIEGERQVQANHPEPTIVRLSFVYGIHRDTDELTGFPAWVRGRLRERERTPLFTDQWISPTRAGQAASVILDLHAREERGHFHVAARSCTTPYEFGDRVRERMGVDSGYLEEGSMEDIDRAADRPSYTCLDVSGVEAALGRDQPTLEEDLAEIDPEFG